MTNLFRVPYTREEINAEPNYIVRRKMHRDNAEYHHKWFIFWLCVSVIGLLIALFSLLVQAVTG